MKASIKATITRGGASIPKPLTYDYMPEGYPSKEDASYNITWDGNTEGHVTIDTNGDGSVLLCKVSDRVLTADELPGASCAASNGLNRVVMKDDINGDGNITVVDKVVLTCHTDNVSFNDLTIPEKGTYFVKTCLGDGMMFVTSLSKTAFAYTPMSYDFMPDGYPKAQTLFDMKLTGEETVKSSEGSFVKVSDMIPSQVDIVDAVVTDVNDIETTLDDVDYVADDGSFFTCYSGKIVIIVKNNAGEDGITFPESGTYFAIKNPVGPIKNPVGPKIAGARSFPVHFTKRTVIRMSEEFIPDGIWQDILAAQIVATDAKNTADNADATAKNAKTAADNALPKSGGTISGELIVGSESESGYRILLGGINIKLQYVNPSTGSVSDEFVIDSGKVRFGNDRDLVYLHDGSLSLGSAADSNLGIHMNANVGSSTSGKIAIQHSTGELVLLSEGRIKSTNGLKFDCNSEIEVVQSYGQTGGTSVILHSSTLGSKKRFRITVDDTGTLTATEVTDNA